MTSSNIGGDKSFVDDLNKERGIVSLRVAFVPRSTEIQPSFCRFVPNHPFKDCTTRGKDTLPKREVTLLSGSNCDTKDKET